MVTPLSTCTDSVVFGARNHLLRTAALVACAALALSPCALAQRNASPTLMAGGSISFALGVDNADVPVYTSFTECGTFGDGSSTVVALDGRLLLPSAFGEGFGFDTRLRFALGSGELTADPVEPTNVRDETTGQMVTLDRQYRLERKSGIAALDLLARKALGPIVLSAGISAGLRFSSSLTQTDNVTGPGSYRFPGGQSSLDMTPGTSGVASFLLQPMLALGFPIALGTQSVLLPEATFRIDAASAAADGSWRAIEFGVGAAVLFDLTPPSTPIAPTPGGGEKE